MNHRMNESEIAETVNISTERMRRILQEHLCMTNLSTRWVPLLLTLGERKQNRVKRIFQPILLHFVRATQPKICVDS